MGIAKTLDGGGVWQLANRVDDSNNISGLDVSEIAFENNNHEVVYLGSLNGGFWVSKDSAATWQQLLSTVSVYDFYVDPTNSDNIFVVGLFANHGKIIRSKDAGATWEELYNEATVGNPVNSITGNPNSGNELYAVLSSGVVIKSVDGGVNWSNTTSLLTERPFISSPNTQNIVPQEVSTFLKMGLDDQSGGVIYITTDAGLFKTTDDGQNWAFINLPVKRQEASPRAVASTRGGVIAYTSIGSTLFKTLDGGQSWQTQQLPSNNPVNKIIIDPVINNISYAGLTRQ